MTYDVNLGIGNSAESGVTGMFYHAPAGTALPTSATATLGAEWVDAGAISSDGISFSPNRSFDDLKDWANNIVRQLPSDEKGAITAPIMYTTEDSLKTLFGEDQVTVTAATSEHGKQITVNMDNNIQPEPQAFLFIMKDGDDMMMIGTKNGHISDLGDISFAPDSAIVWEATIKGNWVFMKDDGQTS